MAAVRHVGDDVPYGIRRPPCGLGNALRMAAARHVGYDVPYGIRRPPCGLGNALRTAAAQRMGCLLPDFEGFRPAASEFKGVTVFISGGYGMCDAAQ